MTRSTEKKAGSGRVWTLVACLIAAVHFASFELTRPIATDIRYYLYFAARTAEGAVPHLDFFDNKTQLAVFTGALLCRLGEALGVEPLTAIRIGYLVLAATTGVWLFAIHRRLADGRGGPGILAALTYSGFALLGFLPSIGNIPKLLMAFFASAAVLLAGDRRWILAGAAGWLAFMDWQIGILALAGVFGATLWDPGRRLRALGESALGALLGAAPFLLYYAAHGALGAAYRQAIAASFVRGSTSFAGSGFKARFQQLLEVIDSGCDGHEWLVAIGVVGMLVYPFWARRHAQRPTLRLVVALAIYHYGVIAFSLVDFQGYGDLFILLHSVAFFASVTIIEAYEKISRAVQGARWLSESTRRVTAFQAVVFLAMVAAMRPSVLRPAFTLSTPETSGVATLADQRAVNQRLRTLMQDKKVVFIGPAELLFLAGDQSSFPFVYWNIATHAYYRTGPEESRWQALERILQESAPELIVVDRHLWGKSELADEHPGAEVASDNDAYGVTVVRWEPSPALPSLRATHGNGEP